MIQRTIAVVLWASLCCCISAQQPVPANHKAVDHVCHVRAQLHRGDTSWGSGVWLDESHVLTALHVVSECKEVSVLWKSERVCAKIINVMPESDWCLLETEPTEKAPTTTVRQEPVTEGESVIGYGFGGVSTNGVRSMASIPGVFRSPRITGRDRPRNGDSGGPVFDSQWRLVGVVNCRRDDAYEWYGSGINGSLNDFVAGKIGYKWAK